MPLPRLLPAASCAPRRQAPAGCPSPRGCAPAGCRSPGRRRRSSSRGRTTVRVAAEHARTGFARRGIVAFERAVDEHVVERDAFACERAQHFFVRRPEILLREGLRAQPVLVRRHHQLEIQPPERPERRDRTGYEFQLFEAVDLVIRGRLRDHGAVAVYEERFFHGRKFLTVSNMRSFSSGRPTVMRRQPSQPAIRERLRTMTPAATSSRYNRSGAAVLTSRKLPSDG